MKAIFKRELRSYFSSPVGFICVAGIVSLYGLMCFQVYLTGSTSYLGEVYAAMMMFSLMIVPIITMKTLSEDKKYKTDQAYLTAPVQLSSIVIGKFFAALSVFVIAVTIGSMPILILSAYSSPPWTIVIGNFIATILYGAAIISIGVFISSLTESQVIAAVGTFIVSISLYFLDGVSSLITNSFLSYVLTSLSFTTRYYTFSSGVFSFSSAIFFISIAVAFVFLTTRKLESRRWN